MREEGKAKAFSGTCSQINNRNTNEFNTFFLSIQKLKPDLSHLTPGMAIFFTFNTKFSQESVLTLSASKSKSRSSFFTFVSSLTLASC